MDALDRLEPVTRGLLRRVDAALATLGATAEHPVWPLLRRLRTTPADAVAFFAHVDLAGLREAADAVRARADDYDGADVPGQVPWRGAAADAYAEQAGALRDHLGAMAGRLRATAEYADEVLGWYARSRHEIARTLARVMTSAQAVTLTATGELSEPARLTGRASSAAVEAAADVGALVLQAAADALGEAADLSQRWEPRLAELAFRPAYGRVRLDGTVEVR